MKTYLQLILRKIVSALCERWDLALENVALRHQIDVLERSGIRPQFTNADRLGVGFLVNGLAPLAGSALDRAGRHRKALAPTGLSILSAGN